MKMTAKANVLLGLLLLGASATAADVSEIALAKPAMRWLWGGFGFHNSEATMTPMMSAIRGGNVSVPSASDFTN